MSQTLSQGIDMIYRISPDGYYNYFNPKIADFMGLKPEEIVGRHFLEFVHEDHHQRVASFYLKQLEEGQESTYLEFPVKTNHGIRWVGQSVELVMVDGELRELLGVARDITKQKATEDKLAQTDFQLMTLINNMDAAIVVEDQNRILQFANQHFCDYFAINRNPEELNGMDCALAADRSKDLFKDPNQFLDGIELSLKNKVSRSGERLVLKNERVYERDYVPIIQDGIYKGHMWLYRDVTMRYLSDQAILESEKKYREVIQNIDLGLMEVDNDEHIIYANEPFLKATGYKLEEIKGRDAKNVLLNEEDLAYHKKTLSKIANQRLRDRSSAYELPIRAKNGKRLWFLISGTAIKDYEGKVIGSLGIHHNITELRDLQSELENRSQLQDNLLKLAGDLMNLEPEKEQEVINEALASIGKFVGADRAYIFDYHLEENFTNNTFEWCATGVNPEIDNLQEVPLDAIPDWPDTHAKGEAMIYQDVAKLAKDNPIRQILEPQGIQSIITVPIRSKESLHGFIGFDAVTKKKQWSKTEIELLSFMAQLLMGHTERRIAEKRVAQSELMQRTILRNALDAVIIINEKGLIEFWNSNAEEIFGYKQEEVLDKSLSGIIIPEKFRAAHEAGIAHYMATGEGPILNQRIELVSIHRDGHSFPVELSIIPIKVGKNQLFAAFLQDISSRKKAQDDMNEALEQQKELARMKSLLISMASHEFRTPLTTIKANAEMLEIWAERLPGNLGEKSGKYFKRLNGEIDRLSNIMTDILIMGRLDSGKIKLKPRNLDLYSFILEYSDKHHGNRKDGRGLQVKLQGSPRILSIDPEIFDHILNNLVGNAFKYSRDAKDPEIRLHYLDDHLRLGIKDYGIGIPQDDVDKIFNSFYRSDNTRGYEGSGMGLAIVKQMIDMHQMELKVFSAEGEGSEFVLEIPYSE